MPPKKKVVAEKQSEAKDIFTKFAGGNEIMNDEQLFAFLTDALEMEGTDFLVGYITASLMKIKKMDETKLENFTALFEETKTTNLVDLKKKLPALRKEALQNHNYKEMYRNVFSLYTGTHTTLDLDVAESLWEVYLPQKLKYYKQLQEYLQQLPDKETKKVHKDLWNMMMEFSLEVNDVAKDYNEDDGWPVFIDNFVEFIKSRPN